MLAGLCRRLLTCSGTVCAMGRNETRIRAIAPAIVPLPCDYNDRNAVDAALRQASAANGAPDLVVAWVHGRAPELRRRLAEGVAPHGRFVQVLGSAHGDPARPERLAEMKAVADRLPLVYQAVVLGFVLERGRARWLGDDEISNGVYGAIERGESLSIVGTVEPWSARP